MTKACRVELISILVTRKMISVSSRSIVLLIMNSQLIIILSRK